MENDDKQAIQCFFDAVNKLKDLNIIRSDKYLGDLAEYISAYFYDIELAESGRQPGHDGHDQEGRVQVKYHGSITRTNIDLGKPGEYETLLVVLGPNSLLRSTEYNHDFLIYRMSANQVRKHKNKGSGSYSCGREPFNGLPDKMLNLY